MPIQCAILGLDPAQQDWFEAIRAATAKGMIEPVAAGHRTASLARDLAEVFAVKAFDDLRQMMVLTEPKLIIMDRPENVTLDFLRACLEEDVAVFSIGPPVRSLAEAQALQDILGPHSHLLYAAPHMASSSAYKRCAQADEFVRPVRFADARFHAFNHTHAAEGLTTEPTDVLVRSMSTLAWDAFGALIDLMGIPESLYATIRGDDAAGDEFTNISGSAALTLRFAERCVVSLTLSDRLGPFQRDLLLAGKNGTLELSDSRYRFLDPNGKLIDEGAVPAVPPSQRAAEELEAFVEQQLAPPSPHRGWTHHLEEIAATMEAMLVSNRTGDAESPERLRSVRR